MLEAFLVGMPILCLMTENPVSSYIVKSILIFFSSAAVLLFSFVPKIVRARDVKRNSQSQLQNADMPEPPGQMLSTSQEDMEAPTSRNATKHNEEHQLKFRFVDIGLPLRKSIRASICLRESDLFDESRTEAGATAAPLDASGADVPKDAVPIAGGGAHDSAVSLGIYSIGEANR